jgi:hypothetical protein
MDKLGVDEDGDKVKTANAVQPNTCPDCGAPLDPESNVAKCPNCGTKPFENAEDDR